MKAVPIGWPDRLKVLFPVCGFTADISIGSCAFAMRVVRGTVSVSSIVASINWRSMVVFAAVVFVMVRCLVWGFRF